MIPVLIVIEDAHLLLGRCQALSGDDGEIGKDRDVVVGVDGSRVVEELLPAATLEEWTGADGLLCYI